MEKLLGLVKLRISSVASSYQENNQYGKIFIETLPLHLAGKTPYTFDYECNEFAVIFIGAKAH